MTSTPKDTTEMDGNEQNESTIEVHISLNGQAFVETLVEQNDQELIEKSPRQQEHPQETNSPNSISSEICLHTIPNMEVHILQESPHASDAEELSANSKLENQDICQSTPTVIVTDAISISSTNLSGISQAVVFSSPVLSAICPSSDALTDIDTDDQNTGLILAKSDENELLTPKTEPQEGMHDSCITLTASSTEITKSITTTPAEGIVVTANQTSMCYLRQIFDGDQVVSPGQMPTIVHGVASDNLPELQQCKWQGCFQHFLSLEDLVRHVNEYHIRTDKNSEFCCYWQGCARNGKGFNARYKMLIHMRTHTGEKPHKCDHENCGKSFSRLENLKIHQRCHTGERPYACPYDGCTKRYSNSSDRFKHTRTHYERKPYHCRIEGCEKCYTDPSSLRKHLRTHHGHEDVNIEDQE